MDTAEWDGVTLRSDHHDTHVADRDRLADAAKDGQWTEVLRLLGTHYVPRTADAHSTSPPTAATTICSTYCNRRRDAH